MMKRFLLFAIFASATSAAMAQQAPQQPPVTLSAGLAQSVFEYLTKGGSRNEGDALAARMQAEVVEPQRQKQVAELADRANKAEQALRDAQKPAPDPK
jgi:hypothetical protein